MKNPCFHRRGALVSLIKFALVGGFLVGTTSPAEDSTNQILSAALTEMARSARHLAFKDVVWTTTRHCVLDFDTNDARHVELRKKLLGAAAQAAAQARREGLNAPRANEAGNQLEAVVKRALREAGLPAQTPVNTADTAQAAGYPDLEILEPAPCYLELKSYSSRTVNSTQRSFYYSPSARPKVTRDALHLLLAFELEKTQRAGASVFVPVSWRLLSLQDLAVDLKFEFNQSNRGLYGGATEAARLGESPAE